MRVEEEYCMGNRLYFELVPQKLMGKAPRNLLLPAEWKRISTYVRERAGGKCEICGSSKALNTHERYGICNDTLILLRFMTLCRSCHLAIHIGFAHVIGKGGKALKRYADLNGLSGAECENDLAEAMRQWQSRINIDRLDWSMIGSEPYKSFISKRTFEKAAASFHDCGYAFFYECECMLPLAYVSGK